jgi:hypothetical protein
MLRDMEDPSVSRKCRVCKHPWVEEIDRDLVEGRLSLRVLSRKYGPSMDSLVHHRDHHLIPVLVLEYAEAHPGAAPVLARRAVENLAQAATSPGAEGVAAAYYLLDLLISLDEGSPVPEKLG